MEKNKKLFYDLVLVTTALIWGVSFVWVKSVLNAGMDSSFFLFVRYLLASLIWLPFCVKDLSHITRRQLLMGVIVGLFLYGGMLVQTIGLGSTTPSNSAFITTSYVVCTPFVTWLILRRRPHKKVYFCAALCFLGVYILTRVPGEAFSLSLGDGLTLISALLFAMQMTFLFRFSPHIPTKLLAFLPQATAAFLCFITAMLNNTISFKGVEIEKALGPIMLVVFVATIGAGYLQTLGQKHVEPSRAAIIFSLESVFACMASVLMGYEHLTVNLVIGGLIIVASIVYVELPERKKEKQTETVPAEPSVK
ncbi:DMT family transporter [Acidaminobacterium chupaoyuni]